MTDDITQFIDNIANDEVPIPTNKLATATTDKPMVVADPAPVQAPAVAPAPVPELAQNNGIAVINQPALPRNKMSPKQRLIADAMEMYPSRTKGELTKMKVAELKELIGNQKLINDTAKLSLKPREELEKMTAPELKQELGTVVNNNLQSMINKEPINLPPNPLHEDMRANTLYNFHRVAFGIIECVSETDAIQARTGSNLAGLCQDLKDEREEFLAILKDVYREHHEDIDKFITPITVYGLFMAEKLGARFAENKKKISSGQSVKSPLKLESLLGLPSQSSLPSSSI